MLIGIESTAAGAENGGDTSYWRGLLQGLAKVKTTNRYYLYDLTRHPFYASLPAQFVSRPLRRPHSLLRHFTSVPNQMRRDDVELVHTQYFVPAGLACPAVLTIHDLHFEHYPAHYPLFDRWFLKICVRASARRAERVIAVSEYTRRDVLARYGLPPSKVGVVPNGLGARFRPVRNASELESVCARYGVTAPFILFVGRLVDPRKNVRMLTDSFLDPGAGLPPGYQLVLAGSTAGSTAAKLAAVAAARGARIVVTGFVADRDLPALMSAATVLVFPSMFEGFGLPVLEAMACGTPVLAANTTAIPEVAGEAARYFDPAHPASLTAALREVLSDAGLRRQMSDLGLERAAAFTWERSAQQTVAIYEAAFGKDPGRP